MSTLRVLTIVLALLAAPGAACRPEAPARPPATASTEVPLEPGPLETPVAPPPDRPPAGPGLPEELIPSPPPADERFSARLALVETTIWRRGVRERAVLRAMLAVPRHEFVPDAYQGQAYADHPLPIGYGQTISQPYIVALMTDLLDLEPGHKVLEIGTGSGYQAAVLAEITDRVFSLEIIPQLAASAAERLQRLGYAAVQVRAADGYLGWPEEAPFDRIIVTAAPDHIPPPLVSQLAEGGIMVIPVGPPGGYQSLWRLVKEEEVTTEFVTGVRFVPLLREPP